MGRSVPSGVRSTSRKDNPPTGHGYCERETMRIAHVVVSFTLAVGCSGQASIEEGGTTSTSTSPLACPDPVPILQSTGEPSGFVTCADGFMHRAEPVTCAQPAAANDCTAPNANATCTQDSDCTARAHGSCGRGDFWPNADACECHYGCATDADCAPGSICACAGVAGDRSRCVPSTCDGDCGEGLCGLMRREGACGERYDRLACLTASSTCRVDAQCQEEAETCMGSFYDVDTCVISEGEWTCGIRSCGPCG